MNKKRVTSIISALICAAMLSVFGLPASANSALTRWDGSSSIGVITADEDCPVTVEKETLSFEIDSPLEEVASDPFELFSDPDQVTAAYTLYNPADYTVTARLLFPFGGEPSYGSYSDFDPGVEEREALDRFGVTVNGEAVERTVRYSLFERRERFELERDLRRLNDSFADDPFLKPDLPVTRMIYVIDGIDPEHYPSASVSFRLPAAGNPVIYFPRMSGIETTSDGYTRVSAWAGQESLKLEICLFGESDFEPDWAAYQTGEEKEGQEIGAEVRKTGQEELTFLEFALSARPDGSPVSDIDWYNAVVAEIQEESLGNRGGNAVSLDGYQTHYQGLLMQWFDYEIELGPGEKIINEVTAPLYPMVDTGYDPPIFQYSYLLSPAKTWTEFGPIDIIVRTPYYLTDSSPEGFENVEEGYRLSLDGLPEGELEFTLSSSEKPEKNRSPLFDLACGLLGF